MTSGLTYLKREHNMYRRTRLNERMDRMKMLIIGSSTRTIRAQELLAGHGISAQIKRLESSAEGCVRGLRVEDGQADRALRLLRENGIPPKGISGVGR